MTPVNPDEQDGAVLSEQVPCVMITLAETQPQYMPLRVACRPTMRSTPMTSRWQLSDEERALIAAGADVYLTLLTFGDRMQPIVLTAGQVEAHRGGW